MEANNTVIIQYIITNEEWLPSSGANYRRQIRKESKTKSNVDKAECYNFLAILKFREKWIPLKWIQEMMFSASEIISAFLNKHKYM